MSAAERIGECLDKGVGSVRTTSHEQLQCEDKEQEEANEDWAHWMLRIPVQMLDGELQRAFGRWYPGMQAVHEQASLAA